MSYVCSMLVCFFSKQFSILQMIMNLEPCLKKSKSASSSSEESVAKPLWKDKREKKRKVEGSLFPEASGSCIQSQEAAVRFIERPDERWRTWGCPGTPHLSWDKRRPVSPMVLMLHWARMLRGWQIVRGEGEGKGKEGVYDFSSKKVTIKSNNVYRGVEGDAWPYTTTYGIAATSRCISGNFTHLSDNQVWAIKIWHISERKNKKRRLQRILLSSRTASGRPDKSSS